MKVLFLSYDGLTDPLGQSQVLAYLEGLVSPTIQIDVISFEKLDRWQGGESPAAIAVQGRVAKAGLNWMPLIYTKSPPILSTLWDLWRMRRLLVQRHREAPYQLIHCRSYLAALVGLWAKHRLGTKFLFDMRGFWADERVDGGLWNPKRFPYSWIYRFFKRQEKRFLVEADEVVSLTSNAEQIIQSWKLRPGNRLPITVIPCCADLDHFHAQRVSAAQKVGLRQRLNLSETDFVVCYLGSVGTWYLLDEMLDAFAGLQKLRPEAKFLFITPDAPEAILAPARKKGLQESDFRVIFGQRNEVPALLSLAQVGLFFIRPAFSKTASSATKLGEFLAMGIPVVTNAGVGDTEKQMKQYAIGQLVTEFSAPAYTSAWKAVFSQLENRSLPSEIRIVAESEYSLTMGRERYRKLYELLSIRS